MIQQFNTALATIEEKTGIRQDWMKHYFICLIFSIAGPYGATFSAGLGLGKEYGDKYAAGNRWDWTDIAADALGITTGLTIWYFLIR